MKRPRDDTAAPSTTTVAAVPLPAAKQYIESRDKDVKVVKNSPYGAGRAALGWGTPFQPPVKCYLDEYPNIHVGISSLNGVPGKDREMTHLMNQYCKKFLCLEHCYPYHRMCDPPVWESWKHMVHKRPFQFTIKANSFLTHTKMLDVDADVAAHIDNFFHQRCAILGGHLGPVLVQLPPQFRFSATHADRIRAVAARMPPHMRVAVEFRHKSWFGEEVYELLRQIRWGLVVTHNEDVGESPFVITNPDFLYVRLHGAVSRYVGDYGPVLMRRWAEVIAKFVADDKSRQVYFFLNNNESQIGGLTSSVVDATCLVQNLHQLLKAGADRGPQSTEAKLSDSIGAQVMGGLEMEPMDEHGIHANDAPPANARDGSAEVVEVL